MTNQSLQFNSSLNELNTDELVAVDGGWAHAIPVIIAVGGVLTTVNEGWKFSSGFVQGFKAGFTK